MHTLNNNMDFSTGLITGAYAILAAFVLYIFYLIEVKLDLPALLNGRSNAAAAVGQQQQRHALLESEEDGDTASDANNNYNNTSSSNNNINSIGKDEFAGVSQARLRQMIESIIAETLTQHNNHNNTNGDGPDNNNTHGLSNGHHNNNNSNGHVAPFPSLAGSVSEIEFETRSHRENGSPTRRHRTEHYFEPKIYQDLLATAVLNKISDQNGRRLSESTPDLRRRHNRLQPHQHPIGVAATDIETQSSGSSIEPRSDCSYTDSDGKRHHAKATLNGGNQRHHQRSLPRLLSAGRESALSDYIATHMVPLPDLSAPATESEEDDYLSVTSSALTGGDGGTWETNWLFKKRTRSPLKGAGSVGGGVGNTVTAGGIGMLVPAPKEDVRAQIGDKVADEVSDLSEMGSETDDSSLDLVRGANGDVELPLNDRLLSKHLIGGQNAKLVLDELLDRSSKGDTPATPMGREYKPTGYTQATNEQVVVERIVPKTEAINHSAIIKSQSREELSLIADENGNDDDDDEEADRTVVEALIPDPLAEEPTQIPKLPDSEPPKLIVEEVDETGTPTNEPLLTNCTTNTNNANTKHQITIVMKTIIESAPVPPLADNCEAVNGDAVSGSASVTNNDCPNDTEGNNTFTNSETQGDIEDDVVVRRFVPGSIAEREYKKWYNAVDMPNNPYTPDALKKRISGSRDLFMDLPNISPSTEQSPMKLVEQTEKDTTPTSKEAQYANEYKRYSRDYYINNGNLRLTPASTPNDANEPIYSDANNNTDSDITTPREGKQQNPANNGPHIIINEPTSASNPPDSLYQAVPVQILDDSLLSIGTANESNQSMQSIETTSSSDDSDAVQMYDFHKQETIKLHPNSADYTVEPANNAQQQAMTIIEHNLNQIKYLNGTTESPCEDAPALPATLPPRRERPKDLQFNGAPFVTLQQPPRGTTPDALKFLQPKRKILQPGQVLSIDNDDNVSELKSEQLVTPMERNVIEEEVAQALPSVKALTLAFLDHMRADHQPQEATTTTAANYADESIKKARPTPTTPSAKCLTRGTPIDSSPNAIVNSPFIIADNSMRWSLTPTTEVLPSIIEPSSNDAFNVLSKEIPEIKYPDNDTTDQAETVTDESFMTSDDQLDNSPMQPIEVISSDGRISPIPVLPSGFLQSSIAFFEGLKSK